MTQAEGGSMSDAVGEAATRLEQAVERLVAVLASRPPAAGVPAESVAALSARLDETLSRLRNAVAELEGQDAADEPPAQNAAQPGTLPDDAAGESRES